MFYVIRPILTITQPSNLQRFRCQSTIQLETAICYQHYFCNTALKTTTKSRIKDFRSRHNETRLHLHLVKLTLDERKTLTKVSTRTTSHKHSPNQSAPFGQQMQAATEHLVKLTLDERKTLTKVSTRKTSHNHSPNQSAPFGQQMQAATEQRRNKQTRQRASCIT